MHTHRAWDEELKNAKNPNLLRVLIRTFGRYYIRAGILTFIELLLLRYRFIDFKIQ